MRRITAHLAAMALPVCAVAATHAQSLSNRIQGVMEQRAAQQQAQYATRLTMLRALLNTGVTVNFDQTPAKEAFAYLKKVVGVDLVYRWSTDTGAASGLDPEATITLTTNGAPALVVLERMLEQATTEPATWQLRPGFVEVGTKERLNARNAQETRIYPIRDLLFEPPMFDNAPEFSLNDAVSQTGTQAGGGQGGGGGGGGGGFGGGGGGGGSGGGGGGGGGGVPLGPPGGAPERTPAQERAEDLIRLITETVEPDAWLSPDVASIRYYDGNLIVRAPDYVQRQLGGYGVAFTPERAEPGPRYVAVTAPIGVSQNVKFTSVPVTGAAGGGGTFSPAAPGAPAAPGTPANGASTPAGDAATAPAAPGTPAESTTPKQPAQGAPAAPPKGSGA